MEGTTERREGKALNDHRTIAKSAGPTHSGGESWDGVENGGASPASRKEPREDFMTLLLLE